MELQVWSEVPLHMFIPGNLNAATCIHGKGTDTQNLAQEQNTTF